MKVLSYVDFYLTLLYFFLIRSINCSSVNNTKRHSVCKLQLKLLEHGDNCIDYERTLHRFEEKLALLNKINDRRNKIAAGNVRSFPTAENMIKLEWNEDLENSAQRWADRCLGHSVPDIQDSCRDLGEIPVGQNIATVYGEAPGLSPLSLVDVWYMELLNTNSSILYRYTPSSQRKVLHYDYFTQLIWSRSKEVGCGGVKFKERLKDGNQDKNRTVHRLVCNFAPGGNVAGEPVYSIGSLCSKCPYGCDKTYKGLCDLHQSITTNINIIADQSENKTSIQFQNNISQITDISKLIQKNNTVNTTNADTEIEGTENIEDDNFTFDYLSHLLDYNKEAITIATMTTTRQCQDKFALEEFVELLKKRLSNDPTFKESLMSSKQQINNAELAITDPGVAAFVNRVYSKNEPKTTTKLPQSDHVNSTLLVNLVEAVIFRNSENTYTSVLPEAEKYQSPIDVRPIRILAERGEVKINTDFTGHYFFPEDPTEESNSENTDVYYDTSIIPVSDVELEIQKLNRDKSTKDFIEEIIESELATESTSNFHTLSFDDVN